MDGTSGPDSQARQKVTGLLAAGDLEAMLAACGGDGATLADLVVALRFLGKQPHPDLGAALRLAFARDELLRRNRKLPAELPLVWARLGEPDRAEAMARTLSDPPWVRGDVLLSLADLAFAAGDTERGLRLADEIEEAAGSPGQLCALATVLSRAGELDRARRLVDQAEDNTSDPSTVIEARIAVEQVDRAEAIRRTHGCSTSALVALAVAEDHPERRRGLIDEALARLHAAGIPRGSAAVFEVLAKAMTDIGEGHRLVGVVKDLASSERDDVRVERLYLLGNVVARVGDLEGARLLLAEARAVDGAIPWEQRLIDQEAWGCDPEPSQEAYELRFRVGESPECTPATRCATALVRVGDREQAEALVRLCSPGEWRAASLATLATRAAAAGDLDRARRLVQEPLDRVGGLDREAASKVWVTSLRACVDLGDLAPAEHRVRVLSSQGHHDGFRAQLAEAWIRVGNLARAEAIAFDELSQAPADLLIALVEARVAAGDLDRAEVIARGAKRPAERARVLIAAAAKTSGTGGVGGLIDEAIGAACAVTPEIERVRALTALIRPLGRLGERERIALVTTEAVGVLRARPRQSDPSHQEVLLAAALAESGELERAQDLAVSHDVPSDGDPIVKVLQMWTIVADGWAAIGDLKRTEDILAAIPALHRPQMLAGLAVASWRFGDRERMNQLFDKAETIGHALPDPHRRRDELTRVATAWVQVGDPERAEAIIRSVPHLGYVPSAWKELADALVAAGELARAGALAFAITIPEQRAKLINSLAEAGDDPDRVRRLVATALVDTPAELLLPVLAKVDPVAVIAAASSSGGVRRP